MQALSQLSYGATLLLASHYRGLLPNWKLFLLPVQSLGKIASIKKDPIRLGPFVPDEWRPHGDSNPGRHRERVMS